MATRLRRDTRVVTGDFYIVWLRDLNCVLIGRSHGELTRFTGSQLR